MHHPDVSSCVVVMRSRAGQLDPQMVAYLVGNSGAQVNEVSVRDLMRRTLPPAAVPDHFVVLSAMPMLPSGKADKSRLPSPVIERPADLGELVEPRDTVEAAVRGLYAVVLHIEHIGVTDDFFDLGGHLLAATRLACLLPDVLGVEVPLRVLFEYPTVGSVVAWARAQVPEPDEEASPVSPEELQERLRQLRELPADVRDDLLDRVVGVDSGDPVSSADRLLAGLPTRDRAIVLARLRRESMPAPPRFPASAAQRRLWYLAALDGTSDSYGVTQTWLIDGILDIDALRRAFGHVIERHEPLRTTFEADESGLWQVVRDPAAPELVTSDLSGYTDPLRQALDDAALWGAEPFDLDAGPLVRFRVARLWDGVSICSRWRSTTSPVTPGRSASFTRTSRSSTRPTSKAALRGWPICRSNTLTCPALRSPRRASRRGARNWPGSRRSRLAPTANDHRSPPDAVAHGCWPWTDHVSLGCARWRRVTAPACSWPCWRASRCCWPGTTTPTTSRWAVRSPGATAS